MDVTSPYLPIVLHIVRTPGAVPIGLADVDLVIDWSDVQRPLVRAVDGDSRAIEAGDLMAHIATADRVVVW
jgi:hypothetical protein